MATDWSRFHHAPKHLDGSSADWRYAQPAKDCKRACDRAFKRALRNYRRNVRPMADEPHSFWDSWPFIVVALLISGAIYVARSQGWLP